MISGAIIIDINVISVWKWEVLSLFVSLDLEDGRPLLFYHLVVRIFDTNKYC